MESDSGFVLGDGVWEGEVDGRILSAERGPMVERLQGLYKELVRRDVG